MVRLCLLIIPGIFQVNHFAYGILESRARKLVCSFVPSIEVSNYDVVRLFHENFSFQNPARIPELNASPSTVK